MRMRRFLTAVALFMAILTVGSSALAYDYTDHVSVAPNGRGDVLIYPLYVSADGWNSRVSVVNTSSYSVVAKVVVRSMVFSQEVLDFMIYLSPFDMWIGYIEYTSTGPRMFSTDSSVLYDSGIHYSDVPEPFATEANPMKISFAPVNCKQDYNTLGYIEVIEAWSGDVFFTTEQKADKQKRGKAIATAYDEVGDFATIVTRNVLSGAIDIDVEAQGLSMTASTAAVALKDYKNRTKLVYDAVSLLGDGSRNNLREIDAALSKSPIDMPFINNSEGTSLHLFTFPTKLSKTTDSCAYAGPAKPTYFSPTSQKLGYTISVYDNDERKAENPFSPTKNYTLPNEFNFLDVTTIIFKQGWIAYTLPKAYLTDDYNTYGQVLRYTGSPVLPLILDFRAGFSLKNASYAEGDVSGTVDGTPSGVKLPLPGYHYSASYSVS